MHHHFEGCLPIREVNAFASFQWQKLSLLSHGRKRKLTSCSQLHMEFFSPDRGSDLARRIQVHVKSYLTWWWMASYLGISICSDKVGGWGWGNSMLLHFTLASSWQEWYFQKFSWFSKEMMSSPIIKYKIRIWSCISWQNLGFILLTCSPNKLLVSS